MKPDVNALRAKADAAAKVVDVAHVAVTREERGADPVVDVAHVAVTREERGSSTTPSIADEVRAFLRRFVSYPHEHALAAHVLWILHTHAMDAWESTPRIAFLSPEPASGKSRALEVTELLVPRPIASVNVTPAYLFRKVGSPDGRPTVLYDEIDTVFGPKTKDNNEEIRGLLNAGHRRLGVAGRCVARGNVIGTEELPAYCAVAMAGLGDLPDTILTRCVVIRMRRRAAGESIEPFRRRVEEEKGNELQQCLVGWGAAKAEALTAARPVMPAGVEDRDADKWEALLAVADALGGDWPRCARDAATALVGESMNSTPSLGIKLLTDLKQIFDGHPQHDALPTESIIRELCLRDESPWGDLRGKPIDARGLAHRLRPYGIRPKTIREGDHTPKGYVRADLHEAWQRYVPPLSSLDDKTTATTATRPKNHKPNIRSKS